MNLEQMWQGATEPVQFPDHPPIPGLHRGERMLETGAIIARSTRLIGQEMTPIHPGVEERIALELGCLPVRIT
jgi:hypothetical protein